MENTRHVNTIAVLVVAVATLLLGPFFVFAYSTGAHSALTQETIKFFNLRFPEFTFTEGGIDFIKKGSVDEDDGMRPLHHFYDPVYERGIFGLINSKQWAKATVDQAGFASLGAGATSELFSAKDDHSWERAIYEYAWGDKNRGLEALGHVLHLIQDASVPDHTRNDPHPPFFDKIFDQASPYEGWTKKFDSQNIDVISRLRNENPPVFSDLDEYFNNLANYSNNNFFSKDTTPEKDSGYLLPEIYDLVTLQLSTDEFQTFAVTSDKVGQYKLALVKQDVFTRNKEYFIKDDDFIVLTDYWSRLSKQAVLHGAGVVKLFFDEVEKEKETKVLYNKNKSWFQKAFDATKDAIFNVASVFYGSSVIPADLEDDLETPLPSEQTAAAALAQPQLSPPPPRQGGAAEPAEPQENDLAVAPPSELEVVAVTEINPPESEFIASSHNDIRDRYGLVALPIGGGAIGGGGSPSAPSPVPDTTSPSAPTVTTPANFSSTFTQTAIIFSGTAEAGAAISQNLNSSTTIVSSDGSWSLALDFNQGSTTIQFFATDQAGNKSEPKEISFFVDSIAPDLTFDITECANTISASGCLSTSTTATLSWSSSASDIASYELSCAIGSANCAGFPKNFSATSSIIMSETLTDYSSYTFTLKITDTAGNQASVPRSIETASRPVVINEIAWMGTDGNSSDEWVEFYNPTSKSITFDSVNNWVLYSSTDNSPFIKLTGSIPAGGYYLIERKNTGETDESTESPIQNITADLWISFGAGLNDGGENLVLSRASSTIDEALQCGTNWCAGNAPSKKTMERYDSFASGILNWGTNNAFFKNGQNVSGVPISGTPKARNSVSYEITNSDTLNSNKTLTKNKSPYLITNNGLTVASGTTLTVDPGVVVKFVSPNEPSLTISGTIKSNGTTNEPVVFTAFTDDTYGGDMNGDGICNPSDASSTATCPQAGLWKQILVNSSSQNSVFTNTIIRYGGKWFNGSTYKSAVAVDNTSATFSGITVEHSDGHGLWLQQNPATAVSNNSIFKNNVKSDSNLTPSGGAGIYIIGGSPTINGNTFENNRYGIYADNASGSSITSNTFTNNATSALASNNNIGSYSSNSGSGNGLNGIVLTGDLGASGTTTLKLNSLPYIIAGEVRVMSGAVLSFEPQIKVKGHAAFNNLDGKLTIRNGAKIFSEGANASDLIFTSLYDDGVGGDSDNASNTPAAGDWQGIFVDNGGILDMKGFTLRYGGGKISSSGTNKGGIRVEGNIAKIDTAIIENNFQNGIRLASSVDLFSIKNTTVRNHTLKTSDVASGIRVIGTDGVLENMVFSGNEKDIKASSGYSIDMTSCNCGSPSTDPSPL